MASKSVTHLMENLPSCVMLITLLAIVMNALKKLLSRQDFAIPSIFSEGLLSGVEKSSLEVWNQCYLGIEQLKIFSTPALLHVCYKSVVKFATKCVVL